MIVAKTITDDLRLACLRQRDISLHEYKLAFTVRTVQTSS